MPVRELLALSTLFYFRMAPEGPLGRRFMDMWDQVRPPVQKWCMSKAKKQCLSTSSAALDMQASVPGSPSRPCA